MARIYFTDDIAGDIALIHGADAHHIHTVLRRSSGDAITVCDSSGMEYGCVIQSCRSDEIRLQILTKGTSTAESSLRITLYQALPKGDKMDFIVEKAVELGAVAVVPFLSEFCISRPDQAAAAKKVQRWQKKMESAAKQSGRGMIPVCDDLISFDELCRRIGDSPRAVFCYERATAPLNSCVDSHAEGDMALIVGCEGGFSKKEADAIMALGIPAVTLGPRILRCETASIVALTLLQYLSHNLD